jgi:hypothetical protein
LWRKNNVRKWLSKASPIFPGTLSMVKVGTTQPTVKFNLKDGSKPAAGWDAAAITYASVDNGTSGFPPDVTISLNPIGGWLGGYGGEKTKWNATTFDLTP